MSHADIWKHQISLEIMSSEGLLHQYGVMSTHCDAWNILWCINKYQNCKISLEHFDGSVFVWWSNFCIFQRINQLRVATAHQMTRSGWNRSKIKHLAGRRWFITCISKYSIAWSCNSCFIVIEIKDDCMTRPLNTLIRIF